MLDVGLKAARSASSTNIQHPTSNIQHPPLQVCILWRLLAWPQGHVRLLPIRPVTGEATPSPQLAFDIHGPDLGHFHFEQLLHGLPHLRLIRRAVHLEAKRIFRFLFGHALFGHDRPEDHFMNGHKESASDNFAAAACDNSTLSCFNSSYTVTSRL